MIAPIDLAIYLSIDRFDSDVMWCVCSVCNLDGPVECAEDSSPFSSFPFDPDPYNVAPLHLSSTASFPPHLPQVCSAVPTTFCSVLTMVISFSCVTDSL